MITAVPVRVAILGAGGAALLLAAVLGLALARGVGGPTTGDVDPGFEQAESFELATLDGRTISLADYADRPVLLYFWASWCAPCRTEAPVIQQLWPEYEARGYAFLAINIWDAEGPARDFAEEFGLTFPIARDVSGDTYLTYGVQGLPEAFFLEPGLRVRDKYIGALTEEVLVEKLEALAPTSAARPGGRP